MADSREYRKLCRFCHELRVAFQNHLMILTEDLQAAGLVTEDNQREVSNSLEPASIRASRLLAMIKDKVKICTQNYYRFIEVLKMRSDYEDILRIRKLLGNSY